MSQTQRFANLFQAMDKTLLDFKNPEAREKTVKDSLASFVEKAVGELVLDLNRISENGSVGTEITGKLNQLFGADVVKHIRFNMEVNSNNQVVLTSSVTFMPGSISQGPFSFKDFLNPGYSRFSDVPASKTNNAIFNEIVDEVHAFLKKPDKTFVDDLKMSIFKAQTKGVTNIQVTKEIPFDKPHHTEWLAKVRQESIVPTGPNSSRSQPSPLLNEVKGLVNDIAAKEWNLAAVISVRPSFKTFVLRLTGNIEVK